MTTDRTPARTYRATTPADLLALVPFVFGFHPEDSLVVLTAGDAQPFHARTDLPDDPDDVAELADHLVDTAVRHQVRQVAVMLFSADAALSEAVAAMVVERFEVATIAVGLCVRADGERWFGLLGSAALAPAAGTTYDVRSHPFTAEAVMDGRVTYASRQELRDSLVGSDPGEVDAVAREADRALARCEAAGRHPLGPPAPEGLRQHLVGEGHWVVHVVRRFLATGEALATDEVGRLVVALASVDVRDAAWAEMDRGSAPRHVHLWRDVLQRCPADLRAAPAGLLAFAAWLSGDGALAWCAVDRCHQADPDYSLARLLAEALVGAVPPSTWRPLEHSELPLFAS